ncbi:YceD family protein [Isoalcanivorax indicus]|uniref:YceD family protein n=1 Tax=Isoalcanivorax indicus TaxID=2202653 RepID=UPI000DB9C83B|nr:YceD family protein [Isoalcanivorax indicus]
MFSGQLPHYVEPRKLADQGGLISGQTTVSALPRLGDFEHSQSQPVGVALTFERDADDGQRIVHGTVSTELVMTCQRCLEPVSCTVTAEVMLALVWSEEEIQALPERYDPWLVTDDKMPLATLLEEELLLALPLVATHEQCPTRLPEGDEPEDNASAGKADNPFAVLASLKGSQK